MDYLGSTIAIIVVIWALGVVTWMIKRTNIDNNRQLDCIMALVDKEKAVISASIGQVRTRSSNGKRGSAKVEEMKSKQKQRRKDLEALHETINETGLITPAQEAELAKYADIS